MCANKGMPDGKVVNIKTLKSDWRRDSSYVYIGRGSSFGNPFPLSSYSREESIAKYEKYFKEKLKNIDFRDEVLQLQGKTLVCFCKPLACHGDVILNWLKRNK